MEYYVNNDLTNNFKEEGYLILKEVFSEKELVEYRSLVQEIIKYAEKSLEDPFQEYYMGHRADQGALYDLFQRHPEFDGIVRNEKILNALEMLIGKDILLYENCLVYKPKNKSNEVPWHQDFMNRKDEPEKYIIWVALDDVTIENGALKVLPGTHKLGFMPWYKVKGETHHTRLKLDAVDTDQYQHVEMKAGDVLIFHHLLIHGSDRVESDLPRRAFRASFQSFDQVFSPRATPIVVRGGGPEALERLYARKKSEVPQKTFVKRVFQALGNRLINLSK